MRRTGGGNSSSSDGHLHWQQRIVVVVVEGIDRLAVLRHANKRGMAAAAFGGIRFNREGRQRALWLAARSIRGAACCASQGSAQRGQARGSGSGGEARQADGRRVGGQSARAHSAG